MATVATKTATPVMPPSFSMSQDISRAMTASNQKTEKTRSILIDGMPPAPPPSPVAFSKGKTCYNNIPSLTWNLSVRRTIYLVHVKICRSRRHQSRIEEGDGVAQPALCSMETF
ncbi:hypothetical protein PENPOL_c006G06630 [Penicillium polonicum]|uniref:Uncharacterized protein n=1 Tax=Penicillium polonicum TaxID=60169 RepID=A0A1V6NKL3_PENPO|nr:hypothetical protein PENPOL_c006G06630 [Penicillium polonicum]